MSQHSFTENGITVSLGYDRNLDYVFCTVSGSREGILYSNLGDLKAGTEQQDVNYYRSTLKDLKIKVPESMFEQVAIDQQQRTGNRVCLHDRLGWKALSDTEPL